MQRNSIPRSHPFIPMNAPACRTILHLRMEYTLYFGPKKLVLTSAPPANTTGQHAAPVIPFTQQADMQTAKKAIGQSPSVYLVAPDTALLLEAAKAHFAFIQAAGGLVQNASGEVLLIYRKGKWDLPKGKLDPGEDLPTCAVREVGEETGVGQLSIIQPLSPTYHTYFMAGQHCLKESHWYLMRTQHTGPMQPQLEEDIEACIWVDPKKLAGYLTNTHPSIADVISEAAPLL
ncbi:8-oxo-dGTP pyrophosphatase MutT, NUDIX family [Cnuella takakiae]|uniref:8-oxo-dGTP pyrophosphatase MutT, NUDIX family n=2 Tax=Cnuella takakiae TaxID=1302690 RepID=A0A1M5GEG2_9BACT|nr:8-oxo-dGTP pyrophosphatase MutT, NUDIX family [Cnuella takakiae]